MKNLYPYHGKLIELALVIKEKFPVTQDYLREYPIIQNDLKVSAGVRAGRKNGKVQFENTWNEVKESESWELGGESLFKRIICYFCVLYL